VPAADTLEQIVQSPSYENKAGLADEFGRDAEAKERLGGRDVVGGRRCVSGHDQLAGNIDDGEGADY
jgi:hypothetical protein